MQVVLQSAALHTVILPRVGPPASIPPDAAISDKKLLPDARGRIAGGNLEASSEFPFANPDFFKAHPPRPATKIGSALLHLWMERPENQSAHSSPARGDCSKS